MNSQILSLGAPCALRPSDRIYIRSFNCTINMTDNGLTSARARRKWRFRFGWWPVT